LPAGSAGSATASQKPGEPASERPGDKDLQGGRKISREGVTVEMSVQPVVRSPENPVELTGGEDAVLSFKSPTGRPAIRYRAFGPQGGSISATLVRRQPKIAARRYKLSSRPACLRGRPSTSIPTTSSH
jgi:hypothetical protein